jgi:hypothetical protein
MLFKELFRFSKRDAKIMRINTPAKLFIHFFDVSFQISIAPFKELPIFETGAQI